MTKLLNDMAVYLLTLLALFAAPSFELDTPNIVILFADDVSSMRDSS